MIFSSGPGVLRNTREGADADWRMYTLLELSSAGLKSLGLPKTARPIACSVRPGRSFPQSADGRDSAEVQVSDWISEMVRFLRSSPLPCNLSSLGDSSPDSGSSVSTSWTSSSYLEGASIRPRDGGMVVAKLYQSLDRAVSTLQEQDLSGQKQERRQPYPERWKSFLISISLVISNVFGAKPLSIFKAVGQCMSVPNQGRSFTLCSTFGALPWQLF